MARLGAFCFPGTGHINPLAALARELEGRGHKVIVFGIADTEARIRSAGLEFQLIGQRDYPLGTLPRLDRQLGQLRGLATFRFTVDRVKNTAAMLLRDGPDAVREAHLDAMLIDEADMAGSISEHLRLPFVSIAFFPPLISDDRIPPFCFPWPEATNPLSRLRNRLGMRLLHQIALPSIGLSIGNGMRGDSPASSAPPTHSRPWPRSRSFPQCSNSGQASQTFLACTTLVLSSTARSAPPSTFPGTASMAARSSMLPWEP